ncbi:MFS transporter, partial [Candidatus Aenigmatarchaeota archaeon]
IEWFILIFFFIGLATSLFYLSINSIITILNKGKAKSLSKLEMMYQVGFILGPLIGGVIAAMMGMVPLFLFWALIMFIGCLIVPRLNFEDKRSSVKSVRKNYLKMIKSDPLNFLLMIIIGMVFLGIAEGARDILIPLYAIDLGFDILVVGIIFMISSIITMVGIVPFGNLADRIGRKPVVLIGFFMIAISFLLLNFLNSIIFLGILTGILSLGRTSGLLGIRTFASDISGTEVRSSTLAIIELFMSTGRIVGAILPILYAEETRLICKALDVIDVRKAGSILDTALYPSPIKKFNMYSSLLTPDFILYY